MPRMTFAAAVSLLALLILWASAGQAAAQTLDADKIKAALHTASPEEDGFVDRVLGLVGQGKLPAKLVYTTFVWARSKPRLKFQYFKQAMILRAARIGIRLD
jgi:hypothetical protein